MLLKFDVLDDLAAAAVMKPKGHNLDLLNVRPHGIGPLVELDWLRRSGIHQLPAIQDLAPTRRSLSLISALDRGKPHYDVRNQRHIGFITLTWGHGEEAQGWFRFRERTQAAAEEAGFPRPVAQQLVGATMELEDNIHLHSGDPRTGLLGFSAVPREFAFVVADLGVGVLASLKRSNEYANLRDVGTALVTALTDGCSRFGRESGHGWGFHGVFQGLTNLNGFLRFRSGDHALTIDGRSPTLSQAQLAQKVGLRGFLISVECRL